MYIKCDGSTFINKIMASFCGHITCHTNNQLKISFIIIGMSSEKHHIWYYLTHISLTYEYVSVEGSEKIQLTKNQLTSR